MSAPYINKFHRGNVKFALNFRVLIERKEVMGNIHFVGWGEFRKTRGNIGVVQVSKCVLVVIAISSAKGEFIAKYFYAHIRIGQRLKASPRMLFNIALSAAGNNINISSPGPAHRPAAPRLLGEVRAYRGYVLSGA